MRWISFLSIFILIVAFSSVALSASAHAFSLNDIINSIISIFTAQSSTNSTQGAAAGDIGGGGARVPCMKTCPNGQIIICTSSCPTSTSVSPTCSQSPASCVAFGCQYGGNYASCTIQNYQNICGNTYAYTQGSCNSMTTTTSTITSDYQCPLMGGSCISSNSSCSSGTQRVSWACPVNYQCCAPATTTTISPQVVTIELGGGTCTGCKASLNDVNNTISIDNNNYVIAGNTPLTTTYMQGTHQFSASNTLSDSAGSYQFVGWVILRGIPLSTGPAQSIDSCYSNPCNISINSAPPYYDFFTPEYSPLVLSLTSNSIINDGSQGVASFIFGFTPGDNYSVNLYSSSGSLLAVLASSEGGASTLAVTLYYHGTYTGSAYVLAIDTTTGLGSGRVPINVLAPSTTTISSTTTSITISKPLCPYDCCNSDDPNYQYKGCPFPACPLCLPQSTACYCPANVCQNHQCVLQSPSYTINFKSGWNLFSVPVTNVFSSSSDCSPTSSIYGYSNGNYYQTTYTTGGSGYWVKMNSDCSETLTGTGVSINDFPYLNAGWNLIGAPQNPTIFTDIIGTCNVVSGPFWYNPATNSYSQSSTLEPDKGYFVKVSSNCQLGTGTPPAPPQ